MLAAAVVAFAGVTVIDVEAGVAKSGWNVVVAGDRIRAAGPSSSTPIPAGAERIDGRGKFLMPGLWDMHVHETASAGALEQYIANGVTGIRDLAADPAAMWKRIDAVSAGKQTGPRILFSAPSLDGPKPDWPQATAVKTPEQGRQEVRKRKQQGVHFIKIYNGLSREEFFAIAGECRRVGIPMVGHTPDSVLTLEAARAGMKSVEHLEGVLRDARRGDSGKLFAEYARLRFWQCPTLVLLRAMAMRNDPKFRADPRLKLFSKAWTPGEETVHPLEQARRTRDYRDAIAVVGQMFRAGVPMLAGTDTGNPFVLPGFSLHDELALLAEAGIPTADVLRMATSNPALFLGMERDLGSVATGKLADLLLLNANPLLDVRNTVRIHTVVADGRVATGQQLSKLADQSHR